MKKTLLLYATVALCLSTVHAQKISFGGKAGVNLTNYSGLETSDLPGNVSIEKTLKLGFHVGGVVEMMFSDKFALQLELLYSQKGFKFNQTTETPIGKTTRTYIDRLAYLTLPIMAKYYILPGLNIHAGPELGYLISAKKEAYQLKTVDVKDNTQKFDLGVGAGIGYRLGFGLFFDFRYVRGFMQINKDQKADSKLKNNAFQLSVGYLF